MREMPATPSPAYVNRLNHTAILARTTRFLKKRTGLTSYQYSINQLIDFQVKNRTESGVGGGCPACTETRAIEDGDGKSCAIAR